MLARSAARCSSLRALVGVLASCALSGCSGSAAHADPEGAGAATGGDPHAGGSGSAGAATGSGAGGATTAGGAGEGTLAAPDPGGAASDPGSPHDGGTAQGGIDGGAPRGVPIDPPVPVGCVTDVAPGVHDFECDTTVHTVSVPDQCTRTACGVIVDVHGGMMSSQMQDENTNLRALGAQHGYIVIQPNAQQNPVLLDQRLFVADAPMQPADDTRVMNILMQVIEAFHADDARIHMTGFSEGGFMTWRWFCAHSDLLASVAPGAAAWQCGNLANLGVTPPEIGCELAGGDLPARNIPVLYMQGMMDGLVDPMCADGWVRSNLMPALQLGAGETLAGDPDFMAAPYVRTRYQDPDGVPFEYIQHQYTSDSAFLGVPIVGHCYPGSTDLTVTPPEQTVIQPDQLMAFGCKDDCDFTWGQEVIAFFIAHEKR